MVRTPKQKHKQGDKPNTAVPSGKAGAAIKTIHYTDKSGHDYYFEWWSALRDYKAKKAIHRRIARLKNGNFGDYRPLRDSVCELRIDIGPGYRVYYAQDGSTIVLLLCGGDKRSQSHDIDRACDFWREWKERKKQAQKKEGGA